MTFKNYFFTLVVLAVGSQFAYSQAGCEFPAINNTPGCTDGPAYDTPLLLPDGSAATSTDQFGEICVTFEKIDDAGFGGTPCDACQQLGGPGDQGGSTFNNEISVLLVNQCTGTSITLIPTSTFSGGTHGGVVTYCMYGGGPGDVTAIPGAGGTPIGGNFIYDSTPLVGETLSDAGAGCTTVIRVLDSAGADPLCVGDASGQNAVIVEGFCPEAPPRCATSCQEVQEVGGCNHDHFYNGTSPGAPALGTVEACNAIDNEDDPVICFEFTPAGELAFFQTNIIGTAVCDPVLTIFDENCVDATTPAGNIGSNFGVQIFPAGASAPSASNLVPNKEYTACLSFPGCTGITEICARVSENCTSGDAGGLAISEETACAGQSFTVSIVGDVLFPNTSGADDDIQTTGIYSLDFFTGNCVNGLESDINQPQCGYFGNFGDLATYDLIGLPIENNPIEFVYDPVFDALIETSTNTTIIAGPPLCTDICIVGSVWNETAAIEADTNTGLSICGDNTVQVCFQIQPPITYDGAHTYACTGTFANDDDEYVQVTLGTFAGGCGESFTTCAANGIYFAEDLDGDGSPDLTDLDGDGNPDFLDFDQIVNALILPPTGLQLFVKSNQPWSLTVCTEQGCELTINDDYNFTEPEIDVAGFACSTGDPLVIFYGTNDGNFLGDGNFPNITGTISEFGTATGALTDFGGGFAEWDPTISGAGQFEIIYTITDALTGCQRSTFEEINIGNCAPECSSFILDLSISEDDVCENQLIDLTVPLDPNIVPFFDYDGNGSIDSGTAEEADLLSLFQFGVGAAPNFFSENPYGPGVLGAFILPLGPANGNAFGNLENPSIWGSYGLTHSGLSCTPEEYIVYVYWDLAVAAAAGISSTCQPWVAEVVTVYPDPATLTVQQNYVGECLIDFTVIGPAGDVCEDYNTVITIGGTGAQEAGGVVLGQNSFSADGQDGFYTDVDVTVYAPSDAQDLVTFGACLPATTNFALDVPLVYDYAHTYTCTQFFENTDDEYIALTTGGITGGSSSYEIIGATGVYLNFDGQGQDFGPLEASGSAPIAWNDGDLYFVYSNQPWSITVQDFISGCTVEFGAVYSFPEPQIVTSSFVCSTGDPITIFYGPEDAAFNVLGFFGSNGNLTETFNAFAVPGVTDLGGGVAEFDPITFFNATGGGQAFIDYTITDAVTGCSLTTTQSIVVQQCAPVCTSLAMDLSIQEDDVCDAQLIDVSMYLTPDVISLVDGIANGGDGNGSGIEEIATIESLFNFGISAVPGFFSDDPYTSPNVINLGTGLAFGIGAAGEPLQVFTTVQVDHSGLTCYPEEYIIYGFIDETVATALGVPNTCRPVVTEVVTVYPDPANLTVVAAASGANCEIAFEVQDANGNLCVDYTVTPSSASIDGLGAGGTQTVTIFAPGDALAFGGNNALSVACFPFQVDVPLNDPLAYAGGETYICSGGVNINDSDEYTFVVLGDITGGSGNYQVCGASGVYLSNNGDGTATGLPAGSPLAGVADFLLVVANQPWSLTICDSDTGCELTINGVYAFAEPIIYMPSAACAIEDPIEVFIDPGWATGFYNVIDNVNIVGDFAFVYDMAFNDLSAALTTIVPGQVYEFDPAMALQLMGGPGTVGFDFELVDVNTGCVAYTSHLINIQACDVDFEIMDPCSCNDDASVNGDDGTFTETVAVTGPGNSALPAGQTWTISEANGVIGVTVGDVLVQNADGHYELTFDHIDAQGYFIMVEGPNAAGDPGNFFQQITNVCFYPDPQIVGVGPFCSSDTAVPLTGIPADGTTGSGVFAGPGVMNIAGTIYFDPSIAGVGEHIISYTFTDDAAGDGTHNPGCAQEVQMTVVVYPEFDPTFELPNQVCTDQLPLLLVPDALADVQAYVAASADTDDTVGDYIVWYEQFSGIGDNGIINNGDGTALFFDFVGAGVYTICTDIGVGSCLRTFCQSIFVHPPVQVTPLTDMHYCADASNIDLTTLFGVFTSGEDQWTGAEGTFYVDGTPIFGSDLVTGALAVGAYEITYAVGPNQDGMIFNPDGSVDELNSFIDACTQYGQVTIEVCADPDAQWDAPDFLCEDGGNPTGTDIDDVIANLYPLTPAIVNAGGVAGTDYTSYSWYSEGGQLFMDANATTAYAGGMLTGETIYFSPATLSDQSEIEICLTVYGAGELEDGAGVDLCAGCSSTQCYEIPIVSEYEADLFDGWNQTWCIEEFRAFETIDLTQYLDNATPGNGYFTVTHHGDDAILGTADDVIATNCGGVNPNPPTIVGCQDGFIWNLDTLGVGLITIRYTVEGSGECARYDEITIELIEAQQDCFAPPTMICESQGSGNKGVYDLTEWIAEGCDDCIDTFSTDGYYNNGVTDILPFDTIDVDGDGLPCYNYPFINPGTQTVQLLPPALPVGTQVLGVSFFYTYESAACVAEGDLDAATIYWPDGSTVVTWGNGAGPNGDDDHFGRVDLSWDEIQASGVDLDAIITCEPQPFTYSVTSNAANFTIHFGVEIIYGSCLFEAVLHESADLDDLGLDEIPLPWDANGDGDYNDVGDIPGGIYSDGAGGYYFDANGLNALDGIIDITYSRASCGECSNATTQSILVVDDYLAEFKAESVSICSNEAMIDMTQYLSSASDNGGNFSSTTHPDAVMGDFIDLTMIGEGNCATVVYDVADGVNTCGQATDTLEICVGAGVDASWTPANYYCEGEIVELPQGGVWSAPYNTDVQAQLDADPASDIINTSNLSNASPVTLTYTVSNGLCTDTQEYLLIIESSYDVDLSETELTACVGNLTSTGAIVFEDITTGNECLDLEQFLVGTTLGAGYWGYAGDDLGDLNGSIFCPTTPGVHMLQYTVPGSGVDGDCGASKIITINIDAIPDAAWNCDNTQGTVICSSDGLVDLDALICDGMGGVQTFEATVCVADPDVEIVDPGYHTTFINLSAIPEQAIITSISLDYNYVAGPGNPSADGDIDLLTITAPDGTVLVNWDNGNDGPNGSDNHFDFGTDPQLYDEANAFTSGGATIDVSTLKGCDDVRQFGLEIYSNSAFWNSCMTVTVTYTTGEFFASLAETGEDLTDLGLAGGIVYEGAGQYSFDPAQLCEINDITIEYVRFGCTCDAVDAQVFEVVCSVSADLVQPTETVCYTDDLDLTQFFAEGTTAGGVFSGSDAIQGHTLVPSSSGGTYTITYTVGNPDSACGNDIDTIEITVGAEQDATWDAPGTFCIFTDSYDLTNYFTTTTTTGGSFAVTSGSGTIDGNNFMPTSLGFVVIAYTVTEGNCTTTWEEVVNVVGDEVPAIVADPVSVCQGDVYDLDMLSASPAGGDWSGAGVTGNLFTTAGLPAGSYTLTYTVGNGDCEQSATYEITVEETPSAAWTSPVEVCADMPSFDLDLYVSGAAGGTWSSSIEGLVDADGTLHPDAAGANPTQEFVFAQVTYTVGGACTASETEVIAVVYVDPYFSGPGVVCIGESVQYEANVPGHWWTGNDLSDTGLFTPTEPGLYDITYSVGGLICHKTYTKTIEVYDIPADPTVSEIEAVCEEDDNRFTYTVSGEFFDHFAVYIDGELAYTSVPFYGNELTYDPLDYLGENFVGSVSVTIVSVNQGGCESPGIVSEYTVYPSPEIEWVLGCTDPETNLAALEVTSLTEDFQIAVYPEGEELTVLSWNPVNDPLAIITAGEIYNITVLDNNGCTATQTGVFAELAVDFAAEVSCPVDGFVTVNIVVDENTGYGGPYLYSYDGGLTYTDESSATLSVAANPEISIRVQDQLGCLSAFQIFEIGEEASIAPSATCADADGNVTVSLNYVGELYSASYSMNGGTPVLIGNAPNFTVNVSEATDIEIIVDAINGDLTCTLTGAITVYPTLTVEADVDNSGCPEGSAPASVTALGGNAPFTVYINGIETGSFEAVYATTLLAGTTDIMVVDANGCMASTTATVQNAVELPTPTLIYNSSLISATSVCGDSDLTLTVAGGTTYAWFDADMNDLGNSSASYTAFVTGPTTYYAAIVSGDCMSDLLEINVYYYPEISTSTPQVTCNGDGTFTATYTISGGNTASPYFVNNVANYGNVSVTAATGSTIVHEIVSPESGCSATVTITDNCVDIIANNDEDLDNPAGTDVTVCVFPNDTYPAGVNVDICGNPQNGTVVYLGDGCFVYTPNSPEVLMDEFCYELSDEFGNTDDAIVTITYVACEFTIAQTALDCQNASGLAAVEFSLANANAEFTVTEVIGGTYVGLDLVDGFGTLFIDVDLDETEQGTYTVIFEGPCGTGQVSSSVNCGNVTAIELLEFDGRVEDEGNLVYWATATEYNTDYFTLQRSIDGVNFESIAKINGAGNSSVEQNYSYVDIDATAGVSYYRLLETELNGSTEIVSGVIELVRDTHVDFAITNVYPVPTSTNINFEVVVANTANVLVDIYDVTGKLIKTVDYNAVAGSNTIEVNATSFAAGTYFVTITQGANVATTKFIKD